MCPPDDTDAPPRRMPPDLLMNPPVGWRAVCQDRVAKIPVGYTYLAQLLGHDMGQSVPLDTVPFVDRLRGVQPVAEPLAGIQKGVQPTSGVQGTTARAPTRYNLIENPLTLETIYGPGPTMLGHLYDPETMMFRIRKGEVLAEVFMVASHTRPDGGNLQLRALYDERNRDTLMLHELAVAWMQFHNLCLGRLGATGFDGYATVRNHAVHVWHRIILNDLLPRFCHSSNLTVPPLDETTLQHGLFRAFHSMPLDSYPLIGVAQGAPLRDILRRSHRTTEAERLGWSVDWPGFLGDSADGPRSGISPSQAEGLDAAGLNLAHRDLATARQTRPNRLLQSQLAPWVRNLPEPWQSRLRADRLAQDFNSRFGNGAALVSGHSLTEGPVYGFLAVEAMLHGEDGGFGPFGSALLRASVEASIHRVRKGHPNPALPAPFNMLDLITLTRKDI